MLVLLAASGISAQAYMSEREEHAVTTEQLTQSKAALTRYVEALHSMGESQAVVSAEKAEAVSNYQEASRELQRMKNREKTVLAKKGLVEIKINKSFNKQQNELA